MKRMIRIGSFFLKLFFAYIIAAILKQISPKYRNIWIISERGDDARDNGYFFYKYLRTKHKEINAWFVIDPKSSDFEKVAALGDWVSHNSFKHYIIYAASVIRVSSSMWGGDLPIAPYFKNISHLMSRKRKFVYLKHGIYKDFDPSSMSTVFHPDKFICGALPEYIHIRDTYGHAEGVVQYTGLARFDSLHGFETKNQILIMPTFRKWIQGKESDEIKKSEFIQTWNAVLKNKHLREALAENQIQLIFYPHYVLQKNVEVFENDCSNIVIAKFADYDVQQLLKESKLLITDFSSVFFDFGYMNKPVIYYQFDREKYIHNHYDFTQGYFSYDANGFGPVAFDHDTLVKEILESIEDNFAVSDEYQKRMDMFFPLNDSNNCDRIFKEVNLLMR